MRRVEQAKAKIAKQIRALTELHEQLGKLPAGQEMSATTFILNEGDGRNEKEMELDDFEYKTQLIQIDEQTVFIRVDLLVFERE